MTKFQFTIVFVFALSFDAAARENLKYDMAGCGLGSMLIKEGGFMQVFAGTTNASLGSQTFGISSGTSNCETKDGIASKEMEKQLFAQAHYKRIQVELAQGGGVFWNALTELFECPRLGGMTHEVFKTFQESNEFFPESSQEFLNIVESKFVRAPLVICSTSVALR